MDSKIRIKMGPIEVEYEGSEAFLKDELAQLLADVSKLHAESGVTSESLVANNGSPNDGSPNDGSPNGSASDSKIERTTNAIAARLNCKSGSDLVLAAAAHLVLVSKKDTFTRKELLDEMKSATGYYNERYRKNLTKVLNTHTKKGRLNEPTKGNFAIPAKERSSLSARLA